MKNQTLWAGAPERKTGSDVRVTTGTAGSRKMRSAKNCSSCGCISRPRYLRPIDAAGRQALRSHCQLCECMRDTGLQHRVPEQGGEQEAKPMQSSVACIVGSHAAAMHCCTTKRT